MSSQTPNQLSKPRLWSMRILFALTAIGLAPDAWREIVQANQALDPFYGVAISFWAALSVLAVFGAIAPARFIPLLLLQLFYKSIWLLGIAYPLWKAGQVDANTQALIMANGVGVVLDLVIIPWRYVWREYMPVRTGKEANFGGVSHG